MSQQHTIGTHKTSVFTDNDDFTKVVYWSTPVVSFNSEKIILNTGGWQTSSTKTRMNQTSNQFQLGFTVFQKDFEWFVEYNGETYPFDTTLEIIRQ